MAHRLTTAPAALVVSAADARTQCRIDDTGEDTYLEALIARATRHCENICNRAFITQTWTLTMDTWNDCRYVTDGLIYIPRPPLIAVSSITYLDVDGDSQTLAADQYRVSASSEPGRIERAYDVIWPDTRGVIDDVTITHTAGYGATGSSVPDDIKHAILMLVKHGDAHRGEDEHVLAVDKGTHARVMDLLDPYIMEVYA